MQSAPALRATGLSVRFERQVALEGLELAVAPGEIVCLLGANGAGKTTTINAFLGFVRPSAGVAEVAGVDVARDPIAARRKVAYLPEQVALYPALSGLENLRYLSALAGARPRDDSAWRTLIKQADLGWDDVRRPVSTYSKGMRQKVGIALAVARQASIVLLDEPTSGLDPKASNELEAVVMGLAREGAAILMVTHDLFRAKQTADRIGIMRSGRLVEMLVAEQVGHAELERVYLEHMRS